VREGVANVPVHTVSARVEAVAELSDAFALRETIRSLYRLCFARILRLWFVFQHIYEYITGLSPPR
jgi:hypothetical protein